MSLRRRSSRAVTALVAGVVMLGTLAGAASADAPAAGAEGGSPTRPAPVTAPPTLLEALGTAHQAAVGVGGLGGVGALPLGDELSLVSDALGVVIGFLNQSHEVVAKVYADVGVDVDEALVLAEELRRRVDDALPAKGELDELAAGTVADLSALADALVLDLSRWAWATVAGVVSDVPTAEEVLTLARDVEAYLRREGDATAHLLLDNVGRISGYLTDEQHQRTVAGALTTLLLTLANQVNPLPDALAPTTQAGFDAAGAFVTWAEGLVTQAVGGPGPFYEEDTDTDTDEPTPSEGETGIDSALNADDEVASRRPVIATRSPDTVGATVVRPLDEHATCTSSEGYDCSFAASQGGRVIHRPIVRVVLAGTYWESSDAAVLRGGLDNLFNGMSSSGYQGILRQYWDKDGYIGPEVVYQGAHVLDVDPPDVVPYDTVVDYAVQAAGDHPGWTTNKSVVWVVALPPDALGYYERGSDTKCGYQNFDTRGGRPYAIALLDHPDQDCTFPDIGRRGSLTMIAAHEYVGAVANPELNGWYSRYGTGDHLPDICINAGFFRGPGGEWVEPVWSNADPDGLDEGECVQSFTPRFAYRVTSVSKPAGDVGLTPGYTRGHSYPGAVVTVVNTGNMPWLSFGAKKSYLGTADNLCSPFADRSTVGNWVSCRRIALPRLRVEPRRTARFVFALKPDGSLGDGRLDLVEMFRPVAGTTWMANTDSRAATLTDIDLNEFAAEVVGVPQLGVVAVGQHGTTTRVRVTLRNTGTAHWYPHEVLAIGTDAPTRYRAADWPSETRAHRVGAGVVLPVTPPGAAYTFDLTLRLPAGEKDLLDTVTFFPFADVRRVADGGISVRKVTRGQIDVQLVKVHKIPVRDVAGYGFASGDAAGTAADESGFSCLAVAGVDTTRTRITSCRATVTAAAGGSQAYEAAAVSADGPVAFTSAAWTGYRPGDGDTVSVCWAAEATFLDGTGGTHSGCS